MSAIDAELMNEFLWTTREEVGQLEVSLVALEQGNRDPDAINAVYRTFHSVKGAAGLVQMPVLEHAAHTCESLLAPCRKDQAALTSELVSVLLLGLDGIKASLNAIEVTGSEDLTAFNCFSAAETILVAGVQGEPDAPSEQSVNQPAVEPRPSSQEALTETPPATGQSRPPTARRTLPEAVLKPRSSEAPMAASPGAAPAGHTSAPSPSAASVPPPAPGTHAPEAAETAVRVDLVLLDKLMNQVGELVLARNRLLQVVGGVEDPQLTSTAQVINQVTSALQEHIMRTRMQPIGNLFAKFPRLIRDLSKQLNKQIELELSGKDTELDRSLLEGLRDPFTHILRNACDHGIERPDIRAAAGKPIIGTLAIRAYHEGGQVIVEIVDDGGGIDPERIKAKALAQGVITAAEAGRMGTVEAINLICHPGLSTAEQVTSISGRGVGMDVVKKNIERMGGSLEILSVLGRGSTFRLKIPLTLAIIPALMVRVGDGLYGIPQLNLVELVGFEAGDAAHHIETVRGAEVYRLRERLLTLVRLDSLLGTTPRVGAADPDGRIFIVVVADGDQQFGLVVDGILDTEEIVVKPLSRHLAGIEWFAGATIRGDGRVALILDMAGVARQAQLQTHRERAAKIQAAADVAAGVMEDFLVFSLGSGERFGVPLPLVNRIESYDRSALALVNGTQVLVRDGTLTPAIDLSRFIAAPPLVEDDHPLYAIVLNHESNAAILVKELVDNLRIDTRTILDGQKLTGSDIVTGLAVVDDIPMALLDVYHLLEKVFPHYAVKDSARPRIGGKAASAVATGRAASATAPAKAILFCEDAQFFQNVVAGYLTEQGIAVDVCDNGAEGWKRLEAEPDRYDLVITDLEMPIMDGWTLIKQIRQFPHYDHLPVVALTSLTDESARQRTLQYGATDYLVKLNRDQLMEVVAKHRPGVGS